MAKEKLDELVTTLVKLIREAVKAGAWERSYENEEPTRENLKNSIPWMMLDSPSEEDRNYVTEQLYLKLRKDGTIAKLRVKNA